MTDDYTASNRALWDTWTTLHLTFSESTREQITRLRAGGSTPDDVVVSEVGDVSERSLLHLQCHFGLDALSWARAGAQVTGVDLSPASIAEVHRLNAEIGLDVAFLCADLYDLPAHLDRAFDIVAVTDGVWPWLPDPNRKMTGLPITTRRDL